MIRIRNTDLKKAKELSFVYLFWFYIQILIQLSLCKLTYLITWVKKGPGHILTHTFIPVYYYIRLSWEEITFLRGRGRKESQLLYIQCLQKDAREIPTQVSSAVRTKELKPHLNACINNSYKVLYVQGRKSRDLEIMYPAQPTGIATTPDGFLLVYSDTHIDVFDAAAGNCDFPREIFYFYILD